MNLDNEENENLINQEPDFITFGDYPEETEPEQLEPEPEETEPEQLEPEPEETETEQELEVYQSETQIDYSEHFVILENLGYLQIVFLGTFLSYFVLTLVVKFIKSFF